MAQQLLDMIARMGGADAIGAMAAKVGLSPAQAQAAVAALAPAVAGGMAKQAQAGNAQVVDELAGRAAALTGSAADDDAVHTGREITQNIFGGSEMAGNVAQAAAAKTGIDPAILAQLLPMVATLAASTLGNRAGAGGLAGMVGGMLGGGAQSQAAPGGIGGMLMGMLDKDKDGNPLDDIMGMFNKR